MEGEGRREREGGHQSAEHTRRGVSQELIIEFTH